MSRRKTIACILSTDPGHYEPLGAALDDLGVLPWVVATSLDEYEKCSKQYALKVVLVDRALGEKELHAFQNSTQGVSVSSFGVAASDSDVLKSFEAGACYQLRHPAEAIHLERLLNHIDAQENTETKKQPGRSAHLYRGLVGESAAVVRLRDLIQKIARSKSTVLITGETGTGKEIVARNIHYYSPQSAGPFVPVNCSAIPADLLESELFGHKKGAFTGAFSDRTGRFAMAAGGTLFLDEIGDMTPELQVKLLRVLEERVIQPVGSNKEVAMTARLVAATHRDLEERIAEGTFREDLYYRLNVVPVSVPSLRDRIEDIPQLTKELSRRLQREQDISVDLSADALNQLKAHHWPGNVRELANLVERLAVICPDGTADLPDLPERYLAYGRPENRIVDTDQEVLSHTLTSQDWPEGGIDLKSFLKSTEASLIQQALDHSGGTVSQAAQMLHLGRTTLVEKVKRLGLSESIGAAE